jgi:hypothetical protein
MGAIFVVIAEVFLHQASQVPLIEHDDMVSFAKILAVHGISNLGQGRPLSVG